MLRLYDFECSNCNHIFERLVAPRETVDCPKCGYWTKRLPPIININMGVGAYGYYDNTLGMGITTNKQRREECIKQGVTPKGDTPIVREGRDLETLR